MNQTGLKLIWVVLRWPPMTSNQNEHLLEGWVTIKILTEKVFPAQDRHASLQEDWEWFYTRMEEPGEERRGEVLSKIFLLSNNFIWSQLVCHGLAATRRAAPVFGQVVEGRSLQKVKVLSSHQSCWLSPGNFVSAWDGLEGESTRKNE